jgi:carbamoyl-phosphate synthase large subunit
MPCRTDIRSILVIGSGPIVIGQACEFDYSGTQACKALKSLGYRVVLINSNPASIMTDPEVADVTYIEPLLPDFVEQVIVREAPDAILPTVGGQTALNLAMELFHAGTLEKYGVELIGAKPKAIEVGEDRALFKEAMEEIGVACARAGVATTLAEAEALLDTVGLPAIIRPSFTLGGEGGGIAYNIEEFRSIIRNGLDCSPTSQVLVEESLIGWKEFELEVIRDLADNVIIICSIENFDPMGVHTGDSITVAPAQTLSDVEYQNLREMSKAIIRKVGVETGGSNIQFSINPKNGDVRVIEMNPRVSRSSALASKATGFPIAKIAAQLAVGLTLDEIPNDITKATPACFEPSLDYVVVKIPRWNFEKFDVEDHALGTVMKAVGEVMGIGRTFAEALLKAISSLEGGYPSASDWSDTKVREHLNIATPDRLAALFEALRRGNDPSEIARMTGIDRWFLGELGEIVSLEKQLDGRFLSNISKMELLRAKRIGMPDSHLSEMFACTQEQLMERLRNDGIVPVFKRVDTCAAEFESFTPYLYSTYEDECESGDSESDRIVIIGNGPNRIGQGLEFDYACCHAAYAVRAAGLTAVMINCNPETVSTDYDTSDKLYFEPITWEHVSAVLEREKPRGVILQFGGQTPLKLAHKIGPVLGTSPDAIDLCEDRDRFNKFLSELDIMQPPGALAIEKSEIEAAAEKLGYPLLVRPSYVLGGRAMRICYDKAQFDAALGDALEASEGHPVLLDKFLVGAVEYDVDALCDGEEVYIAGIMEHIEAAGVHSGDSTALMPPVHLSDKNKVEVEGIVTRIALKLGVVGLVNVQLAIQDGVVYIIEVNPRASRTVPYVSKATGVPVAQIATRLMLGESLRDVGPLNTVREGMSFIKSPVFPWKRFAGADIVLGPEMRSTGEVMGIGRNFGEAYAKGLMGSGMALPKSGGVFLSIRDEDKHRAPSIAKRLTEMGFHLVATGGTHRVLEEAGVESEFVYKVKEGRPDIVDSIKNGKVQLMLNTPMGKKSALDERAMRLAGLRYDVPCITTIEAADALIDALVSLRAGDLKVVNVQELQP